MNSWGSLLDMHLRRLRKIAPVFVLFLLGLGMLLGLTPRAGAQVVFFAGTGHYYEAVNQAGLTWTQARDAAVTHTYLGRNGHLVTITSPQEQAFVIGQFPVAVSSNYWLGAYQDLNAPDYSEPAGGWRWVTGETWDYTSWVPGEPNNGLAGEDFAEFWTNGNWNDYGGTHGGGYIVEYDIPLPTFDVNGDGYADIVYQNTVTNQLAFWYMKGTNYLGGAVAAAIPTAGYKLQGTGDFNGDGKPDLVFQNTTTRQIVFWFMNGATLIGGTAMAQVPAAGYQLVAVGDFNVDGSPDLVFQNTSTRQIAIWYMSRTNLLGFESTRAVPGADYKVVGAADFNGDGQPDLVFQNSSSRAIVFWYMNGGQYQSGIFASVLPLQNFKVVGINDYNNDGQSDILFQNSATGQIAVWLMNGSTLGGGGAVSAVPIGSYLAAGPH